MHFDIPLDKPVLVFALFLCIILFAPALAKKVKAPGIIGLIFAGILIGPHGLNLISKELNITIFSSVGLMYLMFLAGVEINLQSFKNNLSKSIFFGAATFFIPFILGFLTTYFVLKLSFLGSFLVSIMFSTHTLLSYPIVTRYRLNKTLSATLSIAGTIITDTAVLLLLVFVTTYNSGNMNFAFFVKTTIQLALFSFIILYIFPKISRWFLKYYNTKMSNKFIFVLLVVFISGVLAEIIGIEPIIGAFFAGLALNRLIPTSSTLLNNLEFVGNTIFIPFFLISVGMLVDLKVLFSDFQTLIDASILVTIALISKFLAALLTQKTYKFSKDERNLMFGLSSSHAAATIAVILIGYNLNIIDTSILNATILIILISSIVSSFFTEKACKNIIIKHSDLVEQQEVSNEKILVAIANPETAFNLVNFALSIKDKKSENPLYGLNIVLDGTNIESEISKNSFLIDKLIYYAAQKDVKLQSYIKIDINIVDGISKSILELNADKTVIGWNGHNSTTDFIFGSLMQKILVKTDNTIIVLKNFNNKMGGCKKVNVVMPNNILLEKGIFILLDIISRFAEQMYAKIIFYINKDILYTFKNDLKKLKIGETAQFSTINYPDNFIEIKDFIEKEDFMIVVSSRPKHISYTSNLSSIPKTLAKNFQEYNFAIIYPF